jgi:hypothetical protein
VNVAPLTVVALAAFGFRLAKTDHIGRWEMIGHAAIALSLVALCAVVLSGRSGLAGGGGVREWTGLAALFISGASITLSLLYSKRLQDHQVSSAVVSNVAHHWHANMACGPNRENRPRRIRAG